MRSRRIDKKSGIRYAFGQETLVSSFQITMEWENHQEKTSLQGATGAKLWITSLNSHFWSY